MFFLNVCSCSSPLINRESKCFVSSSEGLSGRPILLIPMNRSIVWMFQSLPAFSKHSAHVTVDLPKYGPISIKLPLSGSSSTISSKGQGRG